MHVKNSLPTWSDNDPAIMTCKAWQYDSQDEYSYNANTDEWTGDMVFLLRACA